jgi:hypothetical protein
MRQPVTRALHDYWNGLRGERATPEIEEMNLERLFLALPDAFITEVEAPCRCPSAMCGARMNALWPDDRSNRSFLCIWNDADQDDVKAIFAMVTDGAAPVVGGARGLVAQGSETLDFELLLLPLRHIGRTHSLILGALAATERPPWLGVASLEPLSLLSVRVIGENRALQRPFAGAAPRLTVHRGGA